MFFVSYVPKSDAYFLKKVTYLPLAFPCLPGSEGIGYGTGINNYSFIKELGFMLLTHDAEYKIRMQIHDQCS